MGLQATYSSDQLQARTYGSLGVVLVSLGIPEIQQHAIAHVLRNEAAEALHGLGDALLVGGNDLAEVFWVYPSGERCRADQIGEHDRDLAALGHVRGDR